MTDKKEQYVEKELSTIPPAGCGLCVGDVVTWTNDYGVTFTNRVIGFNTEKWYNKKYQAYVHLDTDSYWFPHKENQLTLASEAVV